MKFFYLTFPLLFFCVPQFNKNKFCDYKSEAFKFEVLLRLARQDNSAYCFFNARNSAGNSTGIGTGGGTGTTTGMATGTGTATGTGVSTVATPVFSPTSGNYNTPQYLTITTSTPGANIYFTINGTTPTSSSTLYNPSAVIHLWAIAGLTFKAIATKSGMTDSAVATAEYSYLPLKTGQSLCYDASNPVACSGTGVDGAFQSGSGGTYVNNGNETITDNKTGLTWLQCPLGLSGGLCNIGGASNTDYPTAISACSSLNFAGRTWRLPKYFELQTLIHYGTLNPAIDTSFFPGAIGVSFWSSTTVVATPTNAYTIDFTNGVGSSTVAKNTSTPLTRCVSGQQKDISSNFVDNQDGTIQDKLTGLVWQKCSRLLTNDASCSGTPSAGSGGWILALTYCNGLNLASRSWRLPNINELYSILDVSVATSPTINTSIFPNTGAGPNYWSSTTLNGNAANGWLIGFAAGAIPLSGKGGGNQIRCVSGP